MACEAIGAVISRTHCAQLHWGVCACDAICNKGACTLGAACETGSAKDTGGVDLIHVVSTNALRDSCVKILIPVTIVANSLAVLHVRQFVALLVAHTSHNGIRIEPSAWANSKISKTTMLA